MVDDSSSDTSGSEYSDTEEDTDSLSEFEDQDYEKNLPELLAEARDIQNIFKHLMKCFERQNQVKTGRRLKKTEHLGILGTRTGPNNAGKSKCKIMH